MSHLSVLPWASDPCHPPSVRCSVPCSVRSERERGERGRLRLVGLGLVTGHPTVYAAFPARNGILGCCWFRFDRGMQGSTTRRGTQPGGGPAGSRDRRPACAVAPAGAHTCGATWAAAGAPPLPTSGEHPRPHAPGHVACREALRCGAALHWAAGQQRRRPWAAADQAAARRRQRAAAGRRLAVAAAAGWR